MPLEEQVARRAGQAVAEVPDAGQAGDAVVERDEQADREDRVAEEVAGDEREHGQQNGGRRSEEHGAERGRAVGGVNSGERLGAVRRELPSTASSAWLPMTQVSSAEIADTQMASSTTFARRGAEYRRPERGEHVGRVVGIAQAQPVGADAGEADRGERGEQVRAEQDDGGDHRGLAGSAVAVAGFLVDGDQRVPAPVDEQAQQHRLGEGAEAAEGERVEPGQARSGGAAAGERGGAEAEQGDQLQPQQHVLHGRRRVCRPR